MALVVTWFEREEGNVWFGLVVELGKKDPILEIQLSDSYFQTLVHLTITDQPNKVKLIKILFFI